MRISKKLLGLILILLLLAVSIWLGLKLSGYQDSKYSAVYLSTGDIYFGEFRRWPKPRVKGAWYIERSTNQENQPQIGVVPMKAVFWGPSEDLYLNPKQIIFWTRLRNDSPMVKALDNPEAANQNPGAPGPSGTSTTP